MLLLMVVVVLLLLLLLLYLRAGNLPSRGLSPSLLVLGVVPFLYLMLVLLL